MRSRSSKTILLLLLAGGCNAREASVQATLPVAGGEVCLGEVCLDVPAGALDGPTDVTLTVEPPDVDGFGPVFSLVATVERFLAPVTLRLPAPEGMDPASLGVAFREADEAWEGLPARAAAAGGIEVSTLHLSRWTVTRAPSSTAIGALAFDPSGALYALAPEAGTLTLVRDAGGTPGRSVTSLGGVALAGASGMTVDDEGRLVVLAWAQRKAVRADDLDGTGAVVGDLGEPGFPYAGGALAARDGKVIAASNDRVVRATTDLAGTSPAMWVPPRACRRVTVPAAAPLDTTPAYADTCQGVTRAVALAIDSAGRVHLLDADLARVVRLDDLSGAGWQVYADPAPTPAGHVYLPVDLAIDALDRLYVAYRHHVVRLDDATGTGRIVVWEGDATVSALAVGPSGAVAIATSQGGEATVLVDACPEDPAKSEPGICGCGVNDDPRDRDSDGLPDCVDAHPDEACGCFTIDEIRSAAAEAGATCLDDSAHFGPGTQSTGVLDERGAQTWFVGVSAIDGSPDAWTCGRGCVEGCASIDAEPITEGDYDACLDLAATCAP